MLCMCAHVERICVYFFGVVYFSFFSIVLLVCCVAFSRALCVLNMRGFSCEHTCFMLIHMWRHVCSE